MNNGVPSISFLGQRVLFSVTNFSKGKSLYRDGMSPLVRSSSPARGAWERVPPHNVFYYRSPRHRGGYVLSWLFQFDLPSPERYEVFVVRVVENARTQNQTRAPTRLTSPPLPPGPAERLRGQERTPRRNPEAHRLNARVCAPSRADSTHNARLPLASDVGFAQDRDRGERRCSLARRTVPHHRRDRETHGLALSTLDSRFSTHTPSRRRHSRLSTLDSRLTLPPAAAAVG